MKTLGFKAILGVALLLSGCVASYGQASQPEVPGDNFSLEGALELFKKSSSPEEFEKMLNTRNTKVNNLDLNGDGYIDYVRVIDLHEGNIHTFVIQAVIAEDEFQDVAVIALEKKANGEAVLQITGNEDIYGVTTIIEPTKEVRTYAGTQTSNAVVNVWMWPVVQYVYGPHYAVWVSPWRWHYRPVWWSPWRPIAYYDYYPIWRPYYHYYAVCHSPRVYVHHIYQPHRRTSVIVHRRYNTQIVHYRENYRNGRTRDDGRYVNSNTSGRRNSVDTNGRQRIDATELRQSRPQSLERTSVTRRGSQLSTPSRRTDDVTIRDNNANARQRTPLPDQEEASRVRSSRDNTPDRSPAPTYKERPRSGSREVQRPRTIERSAPVQRRQAPAQMQRTPAVKSAPSGGGQRQKVNPAPSRERSSPSVSPANRRPSGDSQGTNRRGRR